LKKLLTLVAFSVLLLAVNLPQAHADPCGDQVDVTVESLELPITFFDDSLVVPEQGVTFVEDQVALVFKVTCDKDQVGLFAIIANYVNQGSTTVLVRSHTILFEDLDWNNGPGQVTNFISTSTHDTVTANPVDFGADFVKIQTDEFQIAPEAPQSNAFFVFAEHIFIEGTAVGGEFIPLDTTMVLVAGTQTTVAWMIPVIVSAIGFAIVIARKF